MQQQVYHSQAIQAWGAQGRPAKQLLWVNEAGCMDNGPAVNCII